MNGALPRVAVLVPFWEFWESSARGDLRAAMREIGPEVSRALDGLSLVADEVLFSLEEAPAVARRLRANAPEVVLVTQVMAVPPARTMAVLDELADLPVVVWAMNRESSAGGSFDHSDITTEGATVGTSQLANLLVRARRHFALEVGRLSDPPTQRAVLESVRTAATARRLATAKVARIGSPPPGYDCVTCDAAELEAALGVSIVDIEPAELALAFRDAEPEAIDVVRREALDLFRLADTLDPADDGLDRSFRFAAALRTLDERHQVSAGAINCHLPELRYSPDIGITPCFGLGSETTRGVPWACAGDILTVVAMLTTKLLGGAALYHELERIDYDRDELVVANSGEHDLAWERDPDSPCYDTTGGSRTTPCVASARASRQPPVRPRSSRSRLTPASRADFDT